MIKDMIKEYKKLTAEQEAGLCARMRKGDMTARDLLYESCAPWAVCVSQRIAVRRYGTGVDDSTLDNIIQAGLVGLLESLDKFDPTKGRLTTYSYAWIRKECSQTIWNERTIRLPAYLQARNLLDLDIKPVVSLDSVHNDERSSLPKSLQYTHKGFEGVDNIDGHRVTLWSAETCLTKREREVLLKRSQGFMLREIGAQYGLCRERIRQIQNGALNKLKRKIRQKDE